MNYGFLELLKLVGSLALFLYGMKLMSESLQKLAGNKMRQILAAMTANRFTGVLTGVFITALIQSSSATIGILQAMATTGALTFSSIYAIIIGVSLFVFFYEGQHKA